MMPIKTGEQATYPFAKILSMKEISEINRALGIIEGLTYAIQDSGIADGLVGAVERIEAVIDRENADG